MLYATLLLLLLSFSGTTVVDFYMYLKRHHLNLAIHIRFLFYRNLVLVQVQIKIMVFVTCWNTGNLNILWDREVFIKIDLLVSRYGEITSRQQHMTLSCQHLIFCVSWFLAVIVVVTGIIQAIGQLRASTSLQQDLLYNTLRSPMLFFDMTPTGRILNRFSKDLDVVDTVISKSIVAFLYTFTKTLWTIVVITYSTPMILAIIFPLAVMYLFVQV